MKLYLVKRTDNIDWDEYRGFVVRAENEDEALKICYDESLLIGTAFEKHNTIITELIYQGEKGIILSDYKAG